MKLIGVPTKLIPRMGKSVITFEVNAKAGELEELMSRDNVLIELRKYTGKKTTDQNAYCWELMTQIAEKTHLHKTEVYKKLLRENKVFEDFIILEKAIPTLEQMFRIVDRFGETTINGRKLQKVRCYEGMSEFDKTQMSDFIDLVVTEAEQLGIPTNPDLYKGICKEIK